MGLFGGSRMTPEQLAKAKGQAKEASEAHKLVMAANGYGTNGMSTTAAERRAAEKRLVDQLGESGAKKAMKAAAKAARQ